MSLRTIKPSEARRLLDSGAILIDIRESDEHAREKIPGAHHLPLSKFDGTDVTDTRTQAGHLSLQERRTHGRKRPTSRWESG